MGLDSWFLSSLKDLSFLTNCFKLPLILASHRVCRMLRQHSHTQAHTQFQSISLSQVSTLIFQDHACMFISHVQAREFIKWNHLCHKASCCAAYTVKELAASDGKNIWNMHKMKKIVPLPNSSLSFQCSAKCSSQIKRIMYKFTLWSYNSCKRFIKDK